MVHRPKPAAPQQLRELVRIGLIAFVPAAGLPAAIADDHPLHQRRTQIVQPLRLGAFLERHVHCPAHPPEELHKRWSLRRQDGPGNHAPASSRTEADVVA